MGSQSRERTEARRSPQKGDQLSGKWKKVATFFQSALE
jgi:hypothetical protein